jgi:hypothetical protein
VAADHAAGLVAQPAVVAADRPRGRAAQPRMIRRQAAAALGDRAEHRVGVQQQPTGRVQRVAGLPGRRDAGRLGGLPDDDPDRVVVRGGDPLVPVQQAACAPPPRPA